MCSVLSDSVTPWTVSYQAPLSMEFSKQEYWSRLPFLTPGDLPNPGIKLMPLGSPALVSGCFTTVLPGKPINISNYYWYCLILRYYLKIKVQYSLYHGTTIRILPKSVCFFCLKNDCTDMKALNTYIIKQC